jgi:RES domain-containing protein
MTAWRITKARTSLEAFSGEGAKLYGGRWNSRGTAVIYTAATRSLAMLEVLVHLRGGRQMTPLIPFLLYPVTFDESLVEAAQEHPLPQDWDHEPPLQSSQSFGDRWASACSSAVLAVPSVIIPAELNYLLNPRHPRFPKLKIGKPEPCRIDPRLI